jgi:hypothetical protein
MSGRRIYLASSWRNPQQPELVTTLRAEGHEVYDFRNPPGGSGFGWEQLDPDWNRDAPAGQTSVWTYLDMIDHPVAVEGFTADLTAMEWADTFVLALPCGRSAHLEAGWACGRGVPTAILLGEDPMEPELMYRLANVPCASIESLVLWLGGLA